MTVKDFTVDICTRNEIKDFMEKWHYSHNINGVISNYSFVLKRKDQIIGAMIFGKCAMKGVAEKYGEGVIELRRLACIDDTPKNTESYFIGKALRWLSRNTNIKNIISYSDLTQGHVGIVYKASNFKLIGQVKPMKVIRRISDNRLYHDKTIRTKYKGVLKPFAVKLKNQLENGEAVYENTLSKNIYLYRLKR